MQTVFKNKTLFARKKNIYLSPTFFAQRLPTLCGKQSGNNATYIYQEKLQQ